MPLIAGILAGVCKCSARFLRRISHSRTVAVLSIGLLMCKLIRARRRGSSSQVADHQGAKRDIEAGMPPPYMIGEPAASHHIPHHHHHHYTDHAMQQMAVQNTLGYQQG